jgi:hypothetical protein
MLGPMPELLDAQVSSVSAKNLKPLAGVVEEARQHCPQRQRAEDDLSCRDCHLLAYIYERLLLVSIWCVCQVKPTSGPCFERARRLEAVPP